MVFSPDSKYLACGCGDKTVKILSIEANKVVTALRGHKDKVRSIAYSPDGKILASVSDD
jgi:WD40 repeat protein